MPWCRPACPNSGLVHPVNQAPGVDVAMDYLALACDGDGTLTTRGLRARTPPRAMKSLRDSGRKLLLVTGETRSDLDRFPHLDLFDAVVAENGALLYWPTTRQEQLLTRPPPS